MADGEQSKATAPALNASSAVEVSNFIMRRMDEKIVLHCIVFWAGQTYLYNYAVHGMFGQCATLPGYPDE